MYWDTWDLGSMPTGKRVLWAVSQRSRAPRSERLRSLSCSTTCTILKEFSQPLLFSTSEKVWQSAGLVLRSAQKPQLLLSFSLPSPVVVTGAQVQELWAHW